MTAVRGIGNMLARGFDQAANSLAMTDLRAKSEIARGRFDIERPAFGFCPAGIDLDAYGLACGGGGGGDVLGRDSLRMRDEVAELPAAFCIAGLHRGAGRIVDIDRKSTR